MCEAFSWRPYGKQGWNGTSQGSERVPCWWRAEYKDEGRLVCSKHVSKTKTKLKVELTYDYHGFAIRRGELIIDRENGIEPK